MNANKDQFWQSRLDYLFVLRPMLFFPGWSTMMAGYFIQSKSVWIPAFQFHINHIHLLTVLIGFAMVMGSSFVLNQLNDIESDKKNKKLFIISNGILSTKTVWIEAIILSCLSFLVAFYIKLEVGIFIRLIIDSLPYLCFNTALYLFTTLPDREGDKISGKKTIAVIFNISNIIYAAIIIFLIGLFFSFWSTDRQALIFYILSLPLFINMFVSKKTENTIRATKYGILFFALSICFRWPAYFLMMITGFFGTKWYFKHRFKFDYPNFSGK